MKSMAMKKAHKSVLEELRAEMRNKIFGKEEKEEGAAMDAAESPAAEAAEVGMSMPAKSEKPESAPEDLDYKKAFMKGKKPSKKPVVSISVMALKPMGKGKAKRG